MKTRTQISCTVAAQLICVFVFAYAERHEIHEKYTESMSDFFSVVENVLSIDGSQNFERTFFTFRTIVKVRAEEHKYFQRIIF